MTKRSVQTLDARGKRILVRVDFNVPLNGSTVVDDTRIRAAIPTINLLRDAGAKVILMSHLGRPKGTPNPNYSLAPAATRLGDLLGVRVPVTTLEEAPAKIAGMEPGDIVILENLRFDAGEETNDPGLAAALAGLADAYVNDAFGAAHRAHASVVGVAERLPAYSGLLMQREVDVLSGLLSDVQRPFVVVIGGAKVSDKLAVINHLVERIDALIIGGGMANTFLRAQGYQVGLSLLEPDLVPAARSVLDEAAARGVTVHLPSDVVVAPTIEAKSGTIVSVDQVPAQMAIFDIGPETIRTYAEAIGRARTVFWNGPMGVFEKAPFAAGTLGVAAAVARVDGFTVVGGGDSVAAIEQAGLADQIDHVSTGGGASLELLEGRVLPGVAVLPEA